MNSWPPLLINGPRCAPVHALKSNPTVQNSISSTCVRAQKVYQALLSHLSPKWALGVKGATAWCRLSGVSTCEWCHGFKLADSSIHPIICRPRQTVLNPKSSALERLYLQLGETNLPSLQKTMGKKQRRILKTTDFVNKSLKHVTYFLTTLNTWKMSEKSRSGVNKSLFTLIHRIKTNASISFHRCVIFYFFVDVTLSYPHRHHLDYCDDPTWLDETLPATPCEVAWFVCVFAHMTQSSGTLIEIIWYVVSAATLPSSQVSVCVSPSLLWAVFDPSSGMEGVRYLPDATAPCTFCTNHFPASTGEVTVLSFEAMSAHLS